MLQIYVFIVDQQRFIHNFFGCIVEIPLRIRETRAFCWNRFSPPAHADGQGRVSDTVCRRLSASVVFRMPHA